MIDLHFQVQGETIRVDHGYALFSVISHCLEKEWFHDATGVRLALIRGKYIGNGQLRLEPYSRLTLRLPPEKADVYSKLIGRELDLDGHKIWIGGPSSEELIPSAVLYSHIVTTRNGLHEARFSAEVRRQLNKKGCQGNIIVGRRRIFSIHSKKVVGYSLLISGLTAQESMVLQEQGVGGRRKMGCGFFLPWEG